MSKLSLISSFELPNLHDHEINLIAMVIERDFELRKNENKRVEEIKKILRTEQERVQDLIISKEFNTFHCIQCYKKFKTFFYSQKICSICLLYVCQNCAIYDKPTKSWSCKVCLRLRELEFLTADWFYDHLAQRYKRCGSSKIVRELYKKEKTRIESDEDYGKNNSEDAENIHNSTYIVHNRTLNQELREYSQRLTAIIDNLLMDLPQSNKNFVLQRRNKENVKTYRQQILLEISRAHVALSIPVRRTSTKENASYEEDLQNILIETTEKILQTNIKSKRSAISARNFDNDLAQIVFDKCINREISLHRTESTKSNVSSLQENIREMSELSLPNVDKEEIEMEALDDITIIDKENEVTPTNRSIDIDIRSYKDQDETIDFNDKTPESIRDSSSTNFDWKPSFVLVESKAVSTHENGDIEEEERASWL